MGTPYNDGNKPFGPPTLTIGAVEYLARSWNLDDPSGAVDDHDANGAPNGGVLFDEVITGSATLQLATALTAKPAKFATFTHETVLYVVSKVGEVRGDRELKTVSIEFRKVYNPPS
jgi:hypothetical protein